MTEGTYSIEATVEASGQQKIFDLGSIQIVTESENFDAFNWGILLAIIPVGVITSVFIIKHKRNRKPDMATEELDMSTEELDIEKLPDMLNTILKLGEKIESKDNNSEDNTIPYERFNWYNAEDFEGIYDDEYKVEEEFTCKIATNTKEDTNLIEAGFEYVTERDGLKIYRKRK